MNIGFIETKVKPKDGNLQISAKLIIKRRKMQLVLQYCTYIIDPTLMG